MRGHQWAYHPYSRGKVIGGSSSINGLIFNRGQRMDFDVWAQRGNKGWGYEDILPYFQRYESHQDQSDDKFRGKSGEMTITNLVAIHYGGIYRRCC